jgi:hypothetical protein
LKEDVNVVHIKRGPNLPPKNLHLKGLVSRNLGLSAKASIRVRDVEASVSQKLLSGPSWQRRSFAEDKAAVDFLNEDICSIIQSFGETLGVRLRFDGVSNTLDTSERVL